MKIEKDLKEFENENVNTGVCYINTEKGKVEMAFGGAKIVDRMNGIVKKNLGYKNINSQFSSLFYKREIPELISVKSKGENRYIKLLDSDRMILALCEEDSVNYAKMKIQLTNLCN